MLKKIVLAGLLGVASSGLATEASSQQKFVLSAYAPYAHWMISQGMEQWAKDVDSATQGRVKVEVLKTPLGKPETHYDMARDGITDIAVTVPGYTAGRFILSEVSAIPNVGDTGRGLSVALWRMYAKYPEMQKEYADTKLLGIWTTSPFLFYNSKQPIQKMDDFKGLKIRSPGGVTSDILTAIGAVPVTQPAGKAYELISTGVLDGVVFPKETIVPFKLDKILKYATIVPGGISATSIVTVMNPAKFNALSKQDQDAIMSVSGERLSQLIGPLWDKYGDAGIDALKASGGQVSTASPELAKQISAVSEKAVEGWFKDAKEKRGVDGNKLLAEFRAEVKKVESTPTN